MIEIRELTKRYGSTLAVDSLSFDIAPGVVTGFLGPNGAGKSTTMRMILGLDNPTSGTAKINGRSYRSLATPMHEIGALLEAKALHPGRTARAHLTALAQAAGIPTRRVGEVLELVGLREVAGKRVGGFSLGMSQRLGIAGALLGDPPVLMFDEPVNGLDPEGIYWIRTLMQNLASQGRTVFVSSHLMSEMQETAEHVIVIGQGRLIADTSMTEVINSSTGGRVRVVSPDSSELAGELQAAGAQVDGTADGLSVAGLEAAHIGDLAAQRGLRLHELTPQQVSLEQAFMQLTEDKASYKAGGEQTGGQPADSPPETDNVRQGVSP